MKELIKSENVTMYTLKSYAKLLIIYIYIYYCTVHKQMDKQMTIASIFINIFLYNVYININ